MWVPVAHARVVAGVAQSGACGLRCVHCRNFPGTRYQRTSKIPGRYLDWRTAKAEEYGVVAVVDAAVASDVVAVVVVVDASAVVVAASRDDVSDDVAAAVAGDDGGAPQP